MKKCASCSKDLPEAALHCVFCGAKQAPAPAVQPGLAKTAFGYSANEVRQQLPPQYQPPPQQPRPGPSQPPPMQYQGLAPTAQPHQATVLDPGRQPTPAYAPPPPLAPSFRAGPMPAAPGPGLGGPQHGGMGIHAQNVLTPQPLPQVSPPYLTAPTHAVGPVEPWKHSLRLVMFVWGGLLLAAFATPLTFDPMTFNWDAIIHGEGTAKLPPLILAAVGFLSVVLAAIPLAPLPRGVLAALLGLAGIFVPIFLVGMPEWKTLIGLVGVITLVPGLLVRHEYTESVLARILVTLGVIATLLPLLVPVGSEIPLVNLFKGILDAPGIAKVPPALELGLVVIVVLALLAWMPGPATGGAKLFAWLLILYPLLEQITTLLVAGNIGDAVKASPFGAAMAWVPIAAYTVLIGYGLATVVGKQLE